MPDVNFVKYDEVFLEKSWRWLTSEPIKTLTDTPAFTKSQQEKWFQNLERTKDYFIQGITYDDIPVGVWGLKHISSTSADFWGFIGEIQFWGLGIGKKMMEQALIIAKKKNISTLHLTVLKSNERAIALYKHFNFKEIPEKTTSNLFFMELKI